MHREAAHLEVLLAVGHLRVQPLHEARRDLVQAGDDVRFRTFVTERLGYSVDRLVDHGGQTGLIEEPLQF